MFADEYHSQSLFEAAPQLLQVSGFLGARQNTLGDQSQVDDADTPLDETLEAYAQLIQQGKVRYESLQSHYNLYERAGFETELALLCLRENIGVIPYFSLASGFPAGKYRSEADLPTSARGTFVKKYLNERGFRILGALERRFHLAFHHSLRIGPKVNACQGDVSFVGRQPLHQHRPGPISTLGNTLPECNSAGGVYGPRLQLVGERLQVPHRSFGPTGMRGIGGGRGLRG